MKIAILSMQEVKNYGSFLQAFSLKKHIEELGHTCEFINIVPGEQLGIYKQNKFHKLSLLIKRLWGWDFIKRFQSIYTFQTRFKNEFLPELGVKPDKENKYYDVVVIGSDEVFNCAQKTWFGFSPQLFGEGLNAGKVISYAGSFGATTVQVLEQLGIKERVAQMLTKNFSAISIRDENSDKVVKTLTGKEPELNVDPVILNDWTKYMPTPHVPLKNYMIVYTYPGRITDKQEIAAIRQYAKNRELLLISIGHYFPWVDKTVIPHPFEVLAYFRDASCIITDTFHGSIFSIKNEKTFCTIVRSMNSNKLTFLLNQFGLSNRIVQNPEDLEHILDTPIDYNKVNKIIVEETKKGLEYLKSNL